MSSCDCGCLAVIFRGYISNLIGHKTINIPHNFSGVHSFTGKTVVNTHHFTTTSGSFLGNIWAM